VITRSRRKSGLNKSQVATAELLKHGNVKKQAKEFYSWRIIDEAFNKD